MWTLSCHWLKFSITHSCPIRQCPHSLNQLTILLTSNLSGILKRILLKLFSSHWSQCLYQPVPCQLILQIQFLRILLRNDLWTTLGLRLLPLWFFGIIHIPLMQLPHFIVVIYLCFHYWKVSSSRLRNVSSSYFQHIVQDLAFKKYCWVKNNWSKYKWFGPKTPDY